MGRDAPDRDVIRKPVPQACPIRHAGNHDLEQIIDIAADVGSLDHLRHFGDRGLEPLLLPRVPSLKCHLDIEHQSDAQAKRVQPCMIALDHPRLLESPHPCKAGARREGNALCERLVGDPALGLEDPENTFKALPLRADELGAGHLVVDMVYRHGGTLLLNTAKANGAEVVDGLEILVAQGAASFERWTGRTAPDQAMREAVRDIAI